MKWETRLPEPREPESVLEQGPIRVKVGPANTNPALMWQYFTLTLGIHSTRDRQVCMRTWPRQAIADARAALDKFEAELTELEG